MDKDHLIYHVHAPYGTYVYARLKDQEEEESFVKYLMTLHEAKKVLCPERGVMWERESNGEIKRTTLVG